MPLRLAHLHTPPAQPWPTRAQEATGRVLRELDADILAFQDVHSGSQLQEELREYARRPYQVVHLPEPNGGAERVALATTHRVTAVRPHPGVLEVDLELPGRVPLRVFTVPFPGREGALATRATIQESIRSLPHQNFVVMGQLASSSDTPAAAPWTQPDEAGWAFVDLAQEAGNTTATYPSDPERARHEGSARLDHILASPELARKATSVSVHRTPAAHLAAEHFPLTATFTL